MKASKPPRKCKEAPLVRSICVCSSTSQVTRSVRQSARTSVGWQGRSNGCVKGRARVLFCLVSEEHCCVWQPSTNQLSAYQVALTQHEAPEDSSYLQTSSGLLAKKGSKPWGSLRQQVWSSGSDGNVKCQLSG